MRDYQKLSTWLEQEYLKQFPRSAALHEKAQAAMVDGGNHLIRLMRPFPPRIKAAHGALVVDEDGHEITDFWQGHFANILGHNPEIIARPLSEAFANGYGLQAGFAEEIQIEAAELLRQMTHNEAVRFTTSGALATMYAIWLACAYTQRSLVLKISGGWHGGQPWGMKGVKFKPNAGYDHYDSQGISPVFEEEVIQTQFNQVDQLKAQFAQHGDQLACFILEPFIGGGGFIPATREYLQTARELCDRHGVVLIFDEVISGFRFCAGDLGEQYGVKADLSTFGKIIGGGMPVSAVAGRRAILEMAGRSSGPRVLFSGGTYSGHPASMLATKTMLSYLRDHEQTIYPRIAALGQTARDLCVRAFETEGIPAICTGANDALPWSSLFFLNFPRRAGVTLTSPEDANNPELCDLTLRNALLPLACLLQQVNLLEAHGSISAAHTEQHVHRLAEACQWLARQVNQFG